MTELPTPSPGKYFLGVKEAAALVGVHPCFLYEVLRSKSDDKPRVVRMGSRYRIPRDEFIAWVNRHTDRWAPKGQR
jgi:excisionase family DNA binding protein